MKNIFINIKSCIRLVIACASICGLSIFSGLFTASIASAEVGEYTLKAVYIWRLPSFIEWPNEKEGGNASKPFVISVIGANPFGAKLDELASKRTIHGKKVTVRHLSEVEGIEGSHILFIGRLKEKEMARVLSFTRDRPILTIADRIGASEKGVILNFQIIKSKLHFEINETAAHRSGLVVSSRILRIASRIVHPLKR